MSKQKIRGINADRVFYGVNGLLGALFILVTLYPLIFVVSASFSSGEALMRGEVWLLPKGVNLDAYRTIFKMPEILRGFVNSLFYTALGTAVNVVFTVLAAYPLSRKDLYGRPVLMFLFAFTMMFSGGADPHLYAGPGPEAPEQRLGAVPARGPQRLEHDHYHELFPGEPPR